jgi:hypothetical protein
MASYAARFERKKSISHRSQVVDFRSKVVHVELLTGDFWIQTEKIICRLPGGLKRREENIDLGLSILNTRNHSFIVTPVLRKDVS